MSFENSQVKCKLLVSFQSDMRNKDLMLTETSVSYKARFCEVTVILLIESADLKAEKSGTAARK